MCGHLKIDVIGKDLEIRSLQFYGRSKIKELKSLQRKGKGFSNHGYTEETQEGRPWVTGCILQKLEMRYKKNLLSESSEDSHPSLVLSSNFWS